MAGSKRKVLPKTMAISPMPHGNSAKAAPQVAITHQMVKAIKNAPKGKMPAGLMRSLKKK